MNKIYIMDTNILSFILGIKGAPNSYTTYRRNMQKNRRDK